METQKSLSESESEVNKYKIFYREVKDEDSELREGEFEGDDYEEIEALINDIRQKGGGNHSLSELDTDGFLNRWIEGLVEGSTYDERTVEDIAEHFSNHMMAGARASGKYVVVIVSKDYLLVCHSFTGNKAITVDMDIIHELLSVDNINKYACFTSDENEKISVEHYDNNDTKSFSNWLGIPEEDIVFDVKGDVKIYTEVDDLGCTFQFDGDEVVEKLIDSNNFDLRDGKLITPDKGDFKVDYIRWGNTKYSEIGKFKQDLMSIKYQTRRYTSKYRSISSKFQSYMIDVIDREQKLEIKTSELNEPDMSKEHTEFIPIFVNSGIEMDKSWRSKLAENFMLDNKNYSLFHAGEKFSEKPVSIDGIEIYNQLELGDKRVQFISDLIKTTKDHQVGNLGSLLNFILFGYLEEISGNPISYFFQEMKLEFEIRMNSSTGDNNRIIQKEGGEIGLEYKSGDWIRGEGNDDIADKIVEEISKGSRLIIIGIEEGNEKKIDLVPGDRFKSDRLSDIENKIELETENECNVLSIPLENGILIAVMDIGI